MSTKPNPLRPFKRADGRKSPMVRPPPRERVFTKAPSKAEQAARDAAALDALCARRPLVPPPLPWDAHVRVSRQPPKDDTRGLYFKTIPMSVTKRGRLRDV